MNLLDRLQEAENIISDMNAYLSADRPLSVTALINLEARVRKYMAGSLSDYVSKEALLTMKKAIESQLEESECD